MILALAAEEADNDGDAEDEGVDGIITRRLKKARGSHVYRNRQPVVGTSDIWEVSYLYNLRVKSV